MSVTWKAEIEPGGPTGLGAPAGGGDAPATPTLALRRWLSRLALALTIPAAFVGWAEARYGSIRVALAATRGAPLYVEEPVQALGTHPVGEKAVARVRVWNLTPGAAKILGSSATCGCVTAVALPLTIPASASAELPIEVQFGPNPGPLSQQLTFYTDVPDRSTFRVQVSGLAQK